MSAPPPFPHGQSPHTYAAGPDPFYAMLEAETAAAALAYYDAHLDTPAYAAAQTLRTRQNQAAAVRRDLAIARRRAAIRPCAETLSNASQAEHRMREADRALDEAQRAVAAATDGGRIAA